MRNRNIGESDLEVSAIGLGCALMSGGYKERDDAKSTVALRAALDLGFKYFDSSDAYGNGHNEELLREALGEDMKRVVVGTKFGNVRGPNGERGGTNGKAEYVPIACENNLKRLGVDVIDLYTLHRIDPEVPIEDTVGAMGRLVDEGKVRYIGLCEASADTLQRASKVYKITTLQSEYSLWSRDVEVDILPTCRELGIEFVAYAPLGRGFLGGEIRKPADLREGDRRHDHPRFHEENMAANVRMLETLDGIADAREVHQSQVALAWLLSRGDDILPIPGTSNPAHMQSNVDATEVELTTAELEQLDTAFPMGVTAGTRYPEKQMHLMAQ
jgi:aryl-alcohol dehydrogenase-like predicted oxidoreductase